MLLYSFIKIAKDGIEVHCLIIDESIKLTITVPRIKWFDEVFVDTFHILL